MIEVTIEAMRFIEKTILVWRLWSNEFDMIPDVEEIGMANWLNAELEREIKESGEVNME